MTHLLVSIVAGLFVLSAGVAGAQEPAPAVPAPRPPANAAPLYVAAAKDLLRTFAVDSADDVELPALPDDPAAFAAAADAWRVIVAKAAGERTTFAQAARLPACDFGPGADAFDCGYENHQMALWKLVGLTVAHGMLAVLDRQAAIAAEDAFTLLRDARHLASQPSVGAGALAGQCEVHGLVLLQCALSAEPGPGAKVLERAAVELAEHGTKRGGRRGARACILAEQRRYLDATIGAAKAEPVAKAANETEVKLLREFGGRFTARVLEHSSAWLACLDGDGDFDLKAALAGQAQRKAEIRRRTDPAQLRKQLPKLAPEVAVEELAKMFATMMLVPVDEVLRTDHQAIALLRECRARVERKPAAAGDGR